MAAFNFDPDLPLSAQPFYSQKVLCGHCKETEASLVCPECQCMSFCSKECMETKEHEDFCSSLDKQKMHYKNVLAKKNIHEESTAQQVIEQLSVLSEMTKWDILMDLATAKDQIVRVCMDQFLICKQPKLLEVALDQLMDGRAYYAEARVPPRDNPVFIMLALNKNAEAVATIKDDLDRMRLKQVKTHDIIFYNPPDDKEFNIAIDDEEYTINFPPGLFHVLLALILICLRNEARAKIREEKRLQFEAFCQATATSVLKQDEKEIIGRYIMGKRSKESVVSMDVASATEWYVSNIQHEHVRYGMCGMLRGLKKTLAAATPGVDKKLL